MQPGQDPFLCTQAHQQCPLLGQGGPGVWQKERSPKGIFAGEMSPLALDWRLQKVIWTQWRQDAWELALVGSAFLFIFLRAKPPVQPAQPQGQGGPGSLFLASPAEGSRAELWRIGVGLEIWASLPEGRCRKQWASALLPGVHMHEWSLVVHGCVCICVYCVGVCKCVGRYICAGGVWMPAVCMHDCLCICRVESVHLHLFVSSVSETASGPLCIWEHVGTWMICA